MVKELAASRRMKRSEAAASCTEVNTIAVTLHNLVIDCPTSPQVLVYSATIIASVNVICTEAEKASLAEVDVKFEEAVARLETELNDAQEILEIMSGGMPNPTEFPSSTTPPTTTTTT